MLFDIGERVYLNGNITTNKYPNGDMGFNDIKVIFASNLVGNVYEIELPNLLNHSQFIYTIKIFENLYAIGVSQNQISNIPNPNPSLFSYDNYGINMNLNTNPLVQTSGIKLNSLNTLEQLNELNKMNWVNNQISKMNKFNQNLNMSKKVQKTIIKHIYYKLVDDWLYTKLFPLLAYVKIINGRPQLITSLDEYDINKLASETDEQIELRANYLESKILTKELVSKVTKRVVKKMCFNWYELDKHENMLQKIFLEYFNDLLKQSISNLYF